MARKAATVLTLAFALAAAGTVRAQVDAPLDIPVEGGIAVPLEGEAGGVPLEGQVDVPLDGLGSSVTAPDGITAEGMPQLPGELTGTAPSQLPATITDEPQSLATMRADLAVLGRSLQSLRAELVASGPAGFRAAGGTEAIGRMDSMEAEIARLTGEVEEMRRRVEAAIAEGATRAADIEFRLCEMDPSCDLGALTTSQLDAQGAAASSLGTQGIAAIAGNPAGDSAPAMPPGGTPAENAAFDRAVAAAAAGDHRGAADQFASFVASNPASPLVAEALFRRGEAMASAGDPVGAARAWLETFTAAPSGPRAAPALLNLAAGMAAAGRTEDACRFFGDVSLRFPGTPSALDAVSRSEAAGCRAPAAAPAGDPEEAADLANGG